MRKENTKNKCKKKIADRENSIEYIDYSEEEIKFKFRVADFWLQVKMQEER